MFLNLLILSLIISFIVQVFISVSKLEGLNLSVPDDPKEQELTEELSTPNILYVSDTNNSLDM